MTPIQYLEEQMSGCVSTITMLRNQILKNQNANGRYLEQITVAEKEHGELEKAVKILTDAK